MSFNGRSVDKVARYAHMGGALLRSTATRPSSPLKLNFCLMYWCQYPKTCNIWQRKPTDDLAVAKTSDRQPPLIHGTA